MKKIFLEKKNVLLIPAGSRVTVFISYLVIHIVFGSILCSCYVLLPLVELIDVVNHTLRTSTKGRNPSLRNVLETLLSGTILTTTYHNPLVQFWLEIKGVTSG